MKPEKIHRSSKINLSKIEPLTNSQKLMLQAKGDIVAHGAAGTGKTFCALWMGSNETLKEQKFNHITIIRSAVETRKIGFLPGNEKEKTEVYETPYQELCHEIFEDVNAYEKLKISGKIRFMTTSFIRGLNLRNSFIIVDEYQNMTFHELDSIITRVSADSKLVWCGDTHQADLGHSSGIKDFNKILRKMDDTTFVDFTVEDIVRGPKVKNYLETKYSLFG